ncbi:MAG TPA: transposase, partial [Coleofasciculaceae cyanobacterium]
FLKAVQLDRFHHLLSEIIAVGLSHRTRVSAMGTLIVYVLISLAAAIGDTIAVMQLDQAPAHCAHEIEWPENIIAILQPAHCPELNAIERLWQHLKGLWKGENFASLDALRQRVTQELERLKPQQIQSLTSFDFILDALLQAAF